MFKNNDETKYVKYINDIIVEKNIEEKYANMNSIEKLIFELNKMLELNKNYLPEDKKLRKCVKDAKSSIKILLETLESYKLPIHKFNYCYNFLPILEAIFDNRKKVFNGQDIFNIVNYLSHIINETLKELNTSNLEYSKFLPDKISPEESEKLKSSSKKREEYLKKHKDFIASIFSFERFAAINIKDLKQEDIDIASNCFENFGFKYELCIRMLIYLKNELDKKNNVFDSNEVFDKLVNFLESKLDEGVEIMGSRQLLGKEYLTKNQLEKIMDDLLEMAEYLHDICNYTVNNCYINFPLLNFYFESDRIKAKDAIKILKYFSSINMTILKNDGYPECLVNDKNIPKEQKEGLINNYKSRQQYILDNFDAKDLLTFEIMQEVMANIDLQELTEFDIKVYVETLKNMKFNEEVIEKVEVYLHKLLNKQEEKSREFLAPKKIEEKEELNIKETTKIFLKLNKIIDTEKLELKVPLNSFAEIIHLGVLMKKANFKDEDIAKIIKSAYKREEIQGIQSYSLYYAKLQNLAYQSMNLKMEDISECINRMMIPESGESYTTYKEYLNETLKELLEEVKEHQMYKGDLANYAFELNLINEEMHRK